MKIHTGTDKADEIQGFIDQRVMKLKAEKAKRVLAKKAAKDALKEESKTE